MPWSFFVFSLSLGGCKRGFFTNLKRVVRREKKEEIGKVGGLQGSVGIQSNLTGNVLLVKRK